MSGQNGEREERERGRNEETERGRGAEMKNRRRDSQIGILLVYFVDCLIGDDWDAEFPMAAPLNGYRSYLPSRDCRYSRIMTESSSTNADKKLIKIDISSDTICPWCFVGKKNLDKAIDASKDKYNFEIKWHPFQLNPTFPKEGVEKREYYRRKFGSQSERMEARMSELFRSIGLEYNLSGLTGNTMDSHRLIYFAGQQGLDKQHDLVEELCLGYFTKEKYIGDQNFLLECAKKVGLEGAAEFLQNPNNGLKEVQNELNTYSGNITGVPYYVINGDRKFSGAQPPEAFLKAFDV